MVRDLFTINSGTKTGQNTFFNMIKIQQNKIPTKISILVTTFYDNILFSFTLYSFCKKNLFEWNAQNKLLIS